MVRNDFPTTDGLGPQRRNRCDVRTNSSAVAMADGKLSAETRREPPIRRLPVAGFSFGFALRNDALPGITEAPEVVGYAFVEPANSALHRDLVERPNGVVHRLASMSRRMGCPFELYAAGAVAAVRHRSVRHVPNELFALVASDFLMLCYQPLRAAGFLERVTKATTGPG